MKQLLLRLYYMLQPYQESLRLGQNIVPIDKKKLAMEGYDMVSYFSNAPIQGNERINFIYKDVTYRFASERNKYLFSKNPDNYLPQCDGFCTYGVANGAYRAPSSPITFKIIDQKIYFFFNGLFKGKPYNALDYWIKDEERLLKQLPLNWAKLNGVIYSEPD